MATAECFTTVFDASGRPPTLQFAVFGLVFVAVALYLLVFRKSAAARFRWEGPEGCQIAFGIFILCLAVLWTTAAASGTLYDWWEVNHGSTRVVQGTVEQFHPMPVSGHDTEHFVVEGVRFDYSDAEVTPAFNQTSIQGGPIQAGLMVRIHYVDLGSGPAITRLEVPC